VNFKKNGTKRIYNKEIGIEDNMMKVLSHTGGAQAAEAPELLCVLPE